MRKKPTYEELEKRIQESEKTILKYKQKNRAQKKRHDIIQKVINGVSMLITYIDGEERYGLVNTAYADWYGLNPDQLLGKKVADILSPDVYERVSGNMKKALSGQRISYINKVIARDGSERYVRASYDPHCTGAEVKGFFATVADITDLKKAEDALLLKENIIQSSASAIATCDLEGNMTYGNPFFQKLWGFETPVEFLGKPFQNLWLVKDQYETIMTTLQDAGTWSDEIKAARKDGTLFDVQVSATTVFDDNGNPVALTSTSTDITERKRKEALLRESEEKYRKVVENANEGITVTQDGKLRFVNSKALEISGCSEEELLSKPFIEFVHPDDRHMVMQHHLKRLKGEEIPETYCLRIILKNGEYKHFKNNGVIINWEGKPATLNLLTDITEQKRTQNALINSKKQWEETFDAVWDWVTIIDKTHTISRSNNASKNFTNLSPDQIVGGYCYNILHRMNCPIPDCPLDRAVKSNRRETMENQLDDGRWILISVDPIKSENRKETFVHIVRDITDIKCKEKEILNAHKAEAFSILSGGIAHDYNNLLSVIWGNICLLREDITDVLQQEFFEAAEKACEQARTLTHQFITLSKGATFNKARYSIEDILSAAIEKVEKSVDKNISVHIRGEIPDMEVDPEYLTLAFVNILQNGLEAITGKGQLEIQAGIESGQKKRESLKITFTDTGTGIPKSDLPNVFDPYFTTKELGTQKGLGLGLAVSKSIIKKHGGDIQIDSTTGKGTTVWVYLPLPDFNLQINPASNASARTKPNVLFLEDEPSLVKLYERMLQRLNCNPIAASFAKEAIEKYLNAVKNNEKIDLILLDQNIKGGTGGIETLKELRKNGYDKEAIVITGSPNCPAILDFKKYGFDERILKPFTKNDLKEILDQFLFI